MTEGPDWRPLMAALANPHSRTVFAQVVLGAEPATVGQDLGPSRREHAVRVLHDAGLVEEVEGRLVARPEVFGRALAAASAVPRTGVERFLDGRGKVDRYPSDETEHHALLEHIVVRALDEGEVLTEPELNQRLTVFSDDVATLRRHLVDGELLERTRSGSEYARVSDP